LFTTVHYTQDRPFFIITGDSIIEWSGGDPKHQAIIGHYLSQRLGDVKYMNRGIGGQTVGQISARFKSDVLPYRPRYAIIEGGLNDLSSHSLQEFTTAWQYMLRE
jgi:lysophospholipase L1-like esterase